MANLNRTTTRTFPINNPVKQKFKVDLLHQETFPSLHFLTLTLACVHLSLAVHGTFSVYRRTPVRQITCTRGELIKDIIRFNQRKRSLRGRRWLVFMERAMGTRSGEKRSPLLFSSPVRARTRYFSFRPKKTRRLLRRLVKRQSHLPLGSCIHEMPWKSAILLINTYLVFWLAYLTRSILSIPNSVLSQIFEFVSAFVGILMKFPKAAYYQK